LTNKNDPKGYYELLGVSPTATAEIKAAYRRLAKYLHPDVNAAAGAKAKFQAVNEAYAVLSDSKRRADYDASWYTSEEHQRPAPDLEPICCSTCGKVTAQPRSIVFSGVVSFIVMTTVTPKQGIFCSACARKIALTESLKSALLGWWGFPWGLIYTTTSILSNATGGKRSQDVDDRLTWYNALAFFSKGNYALAYALAREARNAAITGIADGAEEMIVHFQRAGVPPASLKDPWARKPLDKLAHLAMLAIVPGIIGLAMYSVDSVSPRERVAQSQASRPSYDPYRPTVPVSGSPAVDEAAIPSCPHFVASGDILTKRGVMDGDEGHTIEISNGADANAVVKVRNAYSGRLLTSFFVAKDRTAAVSNVPDGSYRVQFAFGGDLGIDCQSFKRVRSASQFDGVETFSTEYKLRGVVKQRLSYTLYSVPNGNVRPRAIDLASFNAE